MKKKEWITAGAGIIMVILGIALGDGSKAVGITLVLTGIAVFFVGFVRAVQCRGGRICPNCGTRVYHNTATVAKIHDGKCPAHAAALCCKWTIRSSDKNFF